MRIESVHFEASGSSTVVVSGGFVFIIPFQRLKELGASIGALIHSEPLASDPRQVMLRLASDGVEFGAEDPLFLVLNQVDREERALSKAAELCARAEQYRRSLGIKLIARGFGRGAVEYAMDRLESEGILDDARYALSWAGARLRRKPMGPLALKAELKAKGLGSAAIRLAVEAIDFNEILPRAARAELDRGVLDRDELKASLRRQGFGYQALSDLLDGGFDLAD